MPNTIKAIFSNPNKLSFHEKGVGSNPTLGWYPSWCSGSTYVNSLTNLMTRRDGARISFWSSDMKEIDKLRTIAKTCYSWSSLHKQFTGKGANSRTRDKFKAKYKDLIDTSHFVASGKVAKYKTISKVCDVCGCEFTAQSGSPREKVVCSYSCSNTKFRSGEDNPNWSGEKYRSVCFLFHEKKCVICGEELIVEVHHYDENHENNSPDNLVPLCPTHHQYFHSRHRHLVESEIDQYVNRFRNKASD